jgi:hypothetical protein
MGRSEVLCSLGLADTGESARMIPLPPPAKFAAFELNGWQFVVSSDHRFASRERISAVSQGGVAVGAYLEEHVMVSGAFGASGGRLVWSVQHDPDHGLEHLDVWGDPPVALAEIHAKLLEQLRTEGGADYVFDAPTELAATVCGFDPNTFDHEVDLTGLTVARKDMMKLRDQPLANATGGPAAPEAAAGARKPGLLARLFGRG